MSTPTVADLVAAIEWLKAKHALNQYTLDYMAECCVSDDKDINHMAVILNAVVSAALSPAATVSVQTPWPRWREMLLDESPIAGAAIKEMDEAFATSPSPVTVEAADIPAEDRIRIARKILNQTERKHADRVNAALRVLAEEKS